MSDLALKPSAPAADDDARAAAFAPRVDVLETENEFLLLADLPGVRPDAVDVRYEQGELTVHGRRPGAHFHRVFAVTDTVAADAIEAELKNGVLTVRLPKIEAVKPRRIAVRG